MTNQGKPFKSRIELEELCEDIVSAQDDRQFKRALAIIGSLCWVLVSLALLMYAKDACHNIVQKRSQNVKIIEKIKNR
ncbi:MAG: hypothetical protein IJD52_02210 [Alphaproteobacteria bacterium]|nr:hypothetical protein [Alphaproteobacteria bacterium]